MRKLKSYYLLVTFEEFNEDLLQEILEVALEYAILPYSSEDKHSLILESASEAALSHFRDRLNYEDFPIIIKKFLR